MKAVRNFFDALRPHVAPGGKYTHLYAFYESIETVFFPPIERTQRLPSVRDSLDVKRYMFLVIVALIPHLCFGIYNAGYFARLASGLSVAPVPVVLTGLWLVMPMVIVTYVVGFFWEILFATIRKHEISEGLFVSCMLFPLTLPPATPLWLVALGISFGIVIGKEVFGGTGRNFLNPALTGRAFLYFAYPVSLSGDSVWSPHRSRSRRPRPTAKPSRRRWRPWDTARSSCFSGSTPEASGAPPLFCAFWAPFS